MSNEERMYVLFVGIYIFFQKKWKRSEQMLIDHIFIETNDS